jgi:hypothetical protein
MPISPALVDQWFNAEQTRAIGIAFERACRSLGLAEIPDPLTDIIASVIIDTARSGESDPARLYEAVMRWASEA